MLQHSRSLDAAAEQARKPESTGMYRGKQPQCILWACTKVHWMSRPCFSPTLLALLTSIVHGR